MNIRQVGAGVSNMIARGLVSLANSATKMQSLQLRLTAREVKDNVEHFEPYGFTSCPLEGAEAVAVFVGGDRSHGVVLVVGDRRYRLKGLLPGELALYSDEGDSIVFKRGNKIDITTTTLTVAAVQKVVLDAPLVEVIGDLSVGGDFAAAGSMSNAGVRVGRYHVHLENDNGGPTGTAQ